MSDEIERLQYIPQHGGSVTIYPERDAEHQPTAGDDQETGETDDADE